jgi:dihydrofolate synthase/folylpolyglutamate synthase
MDFNEVMHYLAECRPYTEAQLDGTEDFKGMQALLDKLGNPERKMKFIHIAGTNGKGSTASILENILVTSGLNVGAYKAPGFDRYNRVIRVKNEEISDEDLIRLVNRVVDAWDEVPQERDLALNEIILAVTLMYFAECEVELAIIKVVMGGRNDITNVIPAPILTLFTPIGLDHVEILGSKLDLIATEKAGIIKEGTTVISTTQPPEAEVVLRLKCMEKGVPFFSAPAAFYKGFNLERKTQKFKVLNTENTRIPKRYEKLRELSSKAANTVFETKMLGLGQLMNAALALGIGGLLMKYGYDINLDCLKRGALDVVWPGSFEFVNEDPYVIVDAAHNVSSVDSLVESLNLYFPEKKIHFVVESPLALNSAGMLLALKDKAADVRVVSDYVDEDQVEKFNLLVESTGIKVERFDDIESALKDAVDNVEFDGIIVSFGSLHQALEVREYFNKE